MQTVQILFLEEILGYEHDEETKERVKEMICSKTFHGSIKFAYI